MRTPLPEFGVPRETVLARLAACTAGDARYADGRVFNSICSQPHPLAVEAWTRHAASNLGDNRLFPGARELEQRVVGLLGDLLGAPDAAGNLVSGGTEANLLALLAAREVAGGRREIVAPASVHFSIEKAARVLGMRLRLTALDARQCADVGDFERALGSDTAVAVASAGTSELGAVDDVEALAAAARRHGVPLHVDAATGGLIVPFARELGHALPRIDFGVPGVQSITVDPHKYGLAVIPSGGILFRDASAAVRFESHYVGTLAHTTLGGTRPGAAAAATYAVLTHLGRAGLRELARGCLAGRQALARDLEARGYSLLVPPQLTIVAVRRADAVEVVERLERRGFLASASRRLAALRLVVHAHHRPEHLSALAAALSELAPARARRVEVTAS
jgi:tyrosine decarboxylase MnfA